MNLQRLGWFLATVIVYQQTKSQFLRDVEENQIDDLIVRGLRDSLGIRVSPSEVASFRNSLNYLGNVLRDDRFAVDLGVSVECQIPQTSKRIDVVLTGRDGDGVDQAVIVELKQWSEASRTHKDGIVNTLLGGGHRDTNHPSYQVWSYACLLRLYNEFVYTANVPLHPCAYLHNCRDGHDLRHEFYSPYLAKAPVFLRDEITLLKEFIHQRIQFGDASGLMYQIERGRVRPSKMLADAVVGLVKQRPEFILVDEQKEVFEAAMDLSKRAMQPSTPKQVLIVEGGPGTGKSVVAVNLVARLIGRGQTAQYVSKNSAPRAVYAQKLSGSCRRVEIENLFKGSGSYTTAPANSLDCLIVDEAHRLNEKSGLFGNLGENQIKEIINTSRCAVFFIDERQRVTMQDIGTTDSISAWAAKFGADVTRMELPSQFRCGGSDGYIAWLDDVLQIRDTATKTMEGIDYDFQVFDCPTQLREAVEAKNHNNRARLVAGYCWNWVSKKSPHLFDIEFPGTRFRAQWNLTKDGSLWIMEPDSIKQVGCIHTCQGLEVDYVGVIIGPDLQMSGTHLEAKPLERAKTDKSLKGWKGFAKSEPKQAAKVADEIIKNTYRTLMTRGMKGCYVYATDPALRAYLKSRRGSVSMTSDSEGVSK